MVIHCIISNCTQLIILVKWKTLFMLTFKRNSDFLPNFYEHQAWSANQLICGLDEVGRGCLFGPVTVAAAILKPYSNHELLQDSKLLSAKERTTAYKWLENNSNFAVSFIDHKTIDAINIYQATLKAMKRATIQLFISKSIKPAYILVDAMPLTITNIDIPIAYFTNGERQSTSIAAASIIAKVTRDKLMDRFDLVFPGYAIASHKGYSTKKHKEALNTLGTTLIHRSTFLSFLNN